MKEGLAGGMTASIPSVLHAQLAPTDAHTDRMVMGSDLRLFDPVWTTTDIAANHVSNL